MKKKEFAVGEEFQLGLKRLKVEEGGNCNDCYFKWICNNCAVDKIVGSCLSIFREDRVDVKFKEVEE